MSLASYQTAPPRVMIAIAGDEFSTGCTENHIVSAVQHAVESLVRKNAQTDASEHSHTPPVKKIVRLLNRRLPVNVGRVCQALSRRHTGRADCARVRPVLLGAISTAGVSARKRLTHPTSYSGGRKAGRSLNGLPGYSTPPGGNAGSDFLPPPEISRSRMPLTNGDDWAVP